MKESVYRRVLRDSGLVNFKKKKKGVLFEKLIKEAGADNVKTEKSNLKEFLKRNNI